MYNGNLKPLHYSPFLKNILTSCSYSVKHKMDNIECLSSSVIDNPGKKIFLPIKKIKWYGWWLPSVSETKYCDQMLGSIHIL